MKIEQLSKKQRTDIYNNHLMFEFHKSEVKPFELMEDLIEKDNYLCFGFFEDTELLGYAYFAKSNITNTLLLDYFVVNEKYRSKGLGSKFILSMKDKLLGKYSSLLAEVENPNLALNADDKAMRERRIKFYLKNGFKVSSVKCSVLVDNYIIINLGLDKELNNEEIYEDMDKIYHTIFGEEFFKKHISISI